MRNVVQFETESTKLFEGIKMGMTTKPKKQKDSLGAKPGAKPKPKKRPR